jgi:hypothetical protein
MDVHSSSASEAKASFTGPSKQFDNPCSSRLEEPEQGILLPQLLLDLESKRDSEEVSVTCSLPAGQEFFIDFVVSV